MKQFASLFPLFLKNTLLTSVFLVAIGFIEYLIYPDAKNIILFLNVLLMIFVPYFLSKHFEVSFSKN